MSFQTFFQKATEQAPFDYQRRMGEGEWPDLVRIPTGLGKLNALASVVREVQTGVRRAQDTWTAARDLGLGGGLGETNSLLDGVRTPYPRRGRAPRYPPAARQRGRGMNIRPARITIELLSNTTFGRGERTEGVLDAEIERDGYDLLMLGGKSLRGGLKLAAPLSWLKQPNAQGCQCLVLAAFATRHSDLGPDQGRRHLCLTLDADLDLSQTFARGKARVKTRGRRTRFEDCLRRVLP